MDIGDLSAQDLRIWELAVKHVAADDPIGEIVEEIGISRTSRAGVRIQMRALCKKLGIFSQPGPRVEVLARAAEQWTTK